MTAAQWHATRLGGVASGSTSLAHVKPLVATIQPATALPQLQSSQDRAPMAFPSPCPHICSSLGTAWQCPCRRPRPPQSKRRHRASVLVPARVHNGQEQRWPDAPLPRTGVTVSCHAHNRERAGRARPQGRRTPGSDRVEERLVAWCCAPCPCWCLR